MEKENKRNDEGKISMKRAIINFYDDTYINTEADSIQKEDGWIIARSGNEIVALVREEFVRSAHLSMKGSD